MNPAPSNPSDRATALRRGTHIENFSLAWNVVEFGAGLAAGIAASSVALIGFALDSMAEASSAAILLWRLHAERRGGVAEDVERRAIRLVSGAFFILAAYIGVRAVLDLVNDVRPEESVPGLVIAGVSLVVMPWLAHRKRVAADALGSRAMHADALQTMLCTYLSAVLLAGLLANSLLGWWWADPVAALVIAWIAVREGLELWRAEEPH
ncbi:MAG: cation transporter [Actinomycetota bacterium]